MRREGTISISNQREIDNEKVASAVSLLFAPGERPQAQQIRMLAEREGGFSISLDPAEEGGQQGGPSWLEILVSGMTFDIDGLAPGESSPRPPLEHAYSLPPGFSFQGLESVTVRPGPHLAGGVGMIPVIRSLAWLAAKLCELPEVQAVVWHSASTGSAPWHFRDSVLQWIGGGVFPGFGLCALVEGSADTMESRGLSLFTGQELRIMPGTAADQVQAAKLALRLLHWLVDHGRLFNAESIIGPEGERLRLDPLDDPRIVEVWRE